MYILLLLFIPLAIPLVAKIFWNHELKWKEIGVQLCVVILLMCAAFYGGRYMVASATEVLNGKVISKEKDRVSCGHSYSCRCRNVSSNCGSAKHRHQCTRRVCDTCYEHSYDVNWNVDTTLGPIRIDRINRQGTEQPPRWTAVYPGEPVAKEHGYTNWVKAVPESLFHGKMARSFSLPAYPTVYDYYRINRVLDVQSGLPAGEIQSLNQQLNEALTTLGPTKQMNIVMLVGGATITSEYVNFLKHTWLGGEKNDLVVVAGLAGDKVTYAEAFGWSSNELVYVQIRDALTALEQANANSLAQAVISNAGTYQRRPMSDYEYLKNEITPSMPFLLCLLTLGILISSGLTWFFIREDVI